MVYDVGNRESFEALDSWLEEIRKDIGSAADLEGVVFAVCANKVRSRREQFNTVTCNNSQRNLVLESSLQSVKDKG